MTKHPGSVLYVSRGARHPPLPVLLIASLLLLCSSAVLHWVHWLCVRAKYVFRLDVQGSAALVSPVA